MKEKHKISKRKILWGVLIFFAVVAILLGLRSFLQYQIYKTSQSNYAISEMKSLDLGGKKQSVLIQAKEKDLPVLVFLHGGPQSPIIYGEGYRDCFSELSEYFTLVFWDQYGSGKNFVADTESIKMEQLTNMTCDLVKSLKTQYPGQKVYLYGYSNGTLLTMEAAKVLGTELAGIINNGPITSLKDAKNIGQNVLEHTDLAYMEQQALKKLEQENTPESFSEIEGMLTMHTSRIFYWKQPFNNTALIGKFLRVFISPDYSLLDVYHAYYASIYGENSYRTLKKDYYEANVKEILENTEVPILICQSEGDIYGAPAYFEKLASERENITYIVIPECAHLPTNTGFEALNSLVIDFGAEQ